jgi:hypothetical protein
MKMVKSHSLDREVVERLREVAHAQWASESELVNQVLAEKLGLAEIAARPIGKQARDERPDTVRPEYGPDA